MNADPGRSRAFLALRDLTIDGPVVADILGEFDDLEGVFSASEAELRQLDGVGDRTIEKIEEVRHD